MNKHYYTIGEVANLLQVKPFVIRFWETEFPQLRPKKDEGRIRKYNQENILLLQKIKDMLYTQKYTIEGARQKLKAERKEARKPEQYKPDEQIELVFDEKGYNLSPSQIKKLKELKRLLQKLVKQA